MDKGSQFYNRPIKSWLQDNDREMYSSHNEEIFVIAGRIHPSKTKFMNIRLQY